MSLNAKWKVFAVFFGLFVLIVYLKIGIELRKYSIFHEPESDVLGSWEPVNYFNETLVGPGVILRTKGGIGNQLFEYACSYALARERNCPLFNFIVRRNNKTILPAGREFSSRRREYALDKFQIPLDNFIDNTTDINPWQVNYLRDFQLLYGNYSNAPFLELSGDAFCQSERYWSSYKSEIISMFRLRPEVVREFPTYVKELQSVIENSEESVAVHIRRGDFMLVPGYKVPTLYQHLAIRKLIKILNERKRNGELLKDTLPKFFLFSDDIDYVRKEFQDFAATYEFVYVSSPNGTGNRTTSIQDFHLMTKCKHLIISNSTFAWWAAYLSMKWGVGASDADRIVIAAKFNPTFYRLFEDQGQKGFYKMLYKKLYYPKEWIIIDVFNGVEE